MCVYFATEISVPQTLFHTNTFTQLLTVWVDKLFYKIFFSFFFQSTDNTRCYSFSHTLMLARATVKQETNKVSLSRTDVMFNDVCYK